MKLALALLFLAVVSVHGHGYLADPLARTSIHIRPDEPYRPPYEWNHSGIECRTPPTYGQSGTCLRCGTSTDMNSGGAYDKNEITGNYTAGSIIDVVGEMTANHRGYFEVELCMSEVESDYCFSKLPIVGGTEGHLIRIDNRICTSSAGGDHEDKAVTARVQLPVGFTCNKCTLRWTYRTSYPPAADHCFNPDESVQTFRNCADITIR